MIYEGKIFESHNVHLKAQIDTKKQAYIVYDDYLYKLLDDYQLERVLAFTRRQKLKFVNDGLWLCEYARVDGDREGSDFLDFYGLGKEYASIAECYALNQVPVVDNKIFCRGRRSSQDRYLCSYDLARNNRKEVEGYYLNLTTDGNLLFTQALRPMALVCFDLELNRIWDYPYQEEGSKANQDPQFNGNLVLICPRNIVYAIEKDTGNLSWQYEFNYSPGSFYVDDGRVYCEQEAHMIVLDAQTGELLIREDTGFIPFDPGEKYFPSPNHISVHPIGEDRLYVASTYEKTIKIFSADGKNCLQTIVLNETKYPWGAAAEPLIVGDLIFQPLGSQHSEYGSGILMLKPAADGVDAKIEIEPRLPTSIYAVPGLQEEHSYQIYIAGKQLDLVQRYAGIALVELLYETARSPSLDGVKEGAFDNLHNGRIEVIVDPESLDEDIDAVMQSLIDDVMGFVELRRIVTAKGNQPISISYKCVKQSEWAQDGELLDLDTARVEGKPLN